MTTMTGVKPDLRPLNKIVLYHVAFGKAVTCRHIKGGSSHHLEKCWRTGSSVSHGNKNQWKRRLLVACRASRDGPGPEPWGIPGRTSAFGLTLEDPKSNRDQRLSLRGRTPAITLLKPLWMSPDCLKIAKLVQAAHTKFQGCRPLCKPVEREPSC